MATCSQQYESLFRKNRSKFQLVILNKASLESLLVKSRREHKASLLNSELAMGPKQKASVVYIYPVFSQHFSHPSLLFH